MVMDNTDLQGIENVLISSKTKSVITDNRGTANVQIFSFEDTLLIHHPGYQTILIPIRELEYKNFTILLEENIIKLQEIIVSANRWEQKKSEVPNLIETIPLKEIDFSNVQTSADMLGLSQSVYIQKSQHGGGSPMIRGFAANRVLIVVDGVRMNNAIFRSGNLQNIISVDALSVEGAEIIMGPGSVIYGSDAIGGVMDFHSMNPKLAANKFNIDGDAVLRYSSANEEKSGHLNFTLSSKKIGFLTSVTYNSFNDLRMGTHLNEDYTRKEYVRRVNGRDSVFTNENENIQRFSGYDQLSMMQKIRFRPNEHIDIQYNIIYSELSDVPRYDRLIEYKDNQLTYAEWYYGPQKWLSNSIHIKIDKSNKLFDHFKIIGAYQLFVESRNDRKLDNIYLNQKTEDVYMASVNVDFEKKIKGNNDLYYGLEFVSNLVHSKGFVTDINNFNQTADASRYPDGSTYKSYAGYIDYKKKFNEKYILNLGARYSRVILNADFDTTFYNFPFTNITSNHGALNGCAGLVYNPNTYWNFKFNLSSGFRAPNIDDIAKVFDSEPGNVVVPNPELKPEYAYNVELSALRNVSEKIQLGASYYYTYLDDAIVRRDYAFNGMDSIMYNGEMSKVQALVNASNAFVFGFQLSINAELFKNIYFKAYLCYTNGQEEDEESGEYVPLRHAPPLFGSTHLTYKTSKFKAEFFVDFNSEISTENLAPSEKSKPAIYAKDDDGNPYCPAWQTLNFKMAYYLNKYFHVNFGIENIFDVRYRPYSSGLVSAGRNFIVSVKTTF
jgi:hemoglobin/transferrin/lactoferrin receptor protein